MKELTLPCVTLAVLCLLGCDRTEPTEPTDVKVKDGAEPKSDRAVPSGTQAEPSSNTKAPSAKAPEVGPNAPSAVGSSHDHEPGQAAPTAQGPQTRAEYIAASRRRLDEMESELQHLEARGKERGKELRKEIREEKRRLDADLARMDAESDEAWSQMKDGFADALERLEAQIHQVRKDIDPDA